MAEPRTVTILFTDLVGSTELLQRAGDEAAQRIFKAHHRLLREAVESHGGHEVKWLGDGLMVAFDSALDAVKCAIAMQQASRRPTAGERLQIRAGLNVGEAFVDESDYFGTSVVVARRLCDRADAGQILASEIVARLVQDRAGDFDIKPLGAVELKGITNPLEAIEVRYHHDPMALLRKLPFVGRQSEYDALLRKLAEASNGRGSVVLLAGEPGIGKTRLTEEFLEHASSSANIIRGNCYESDVAAPFGPWVEALQSLADNLPIDVLRDAVRDGAPEVAVLLPELRRKLPDIPEAIKLDDPESGRTRVFQAVAAFLKNAASSKPLVIFLDDLHWCDKPSLLLLEFVARGIQDQRVMIVGAYRDVEVDRVHPLAQTLATLRRLEHHERLAIRGFTEDAVFDLLAAIEPSQATEPARRVLAGALFAEAEGNPFFIREVLNNLVESGKLVHQGGVWIGTVSSIEELGIPEGIKEAIGRRLSRLSDGCNQLLGRASAFSSGFSWEELTAVSDEPEEKLLDHLDEALGAQLITERGRGRYTFTHALVRATLYGELSTPRRTRLHRRVAESLEALYADDIDSHLGELAAHYMASVGGVADKAVEYSIRAGTRAMELIAWEEAVAYFQQALDAMPENGDEERRCGVLLDLGLALQWTGQIERALDIYRSAVKVARSVASPELLSRAALGFETAVADAHVDAEIPLERLSQIEEALSALGPGDSPTRAHLLAHHAYVQHIVSGRDDPVRRAGWGSTLGQKSPEVVAQLREAAAMAERAGDPIVLCTVLQETLTLLDTVDNAAERMANARKSIHGAREAGNRGLEFSGLHQLFLASIAAADLETARSISAEEVRIAEQMKLPWWRSVAYRSQSTLATAEGRFGEAERFAFNALTLGQGRSATAPLSYMAQLSTLRVYQGRAGEMEPMWRAAVDRSPGQASFKGALMLCLLDAGKPEGAALLFDELGRAGFRSIPLDAQWTAATWGLGEACFHIGRRDSTPELYEVMSPHDQGNATAGDSACYGPIARSIGIVASVLGDFANAERHLRAAIDLSDKTGLRVSLAQGRMNYGDMLLRRDGPGDREKARALLRQAVEAAQDMGMARVLADSKRLLGSLDG